MGMTKPFLPQRGGYRSLKVYRVTTLIYDLTYHFAHTYLKAYDRTIDQMVQAARSGKQNIAEGSAAGTHSSETEIKLTSVAKASLEELLVDYEDYLRTRGLPGWGPGHPRYDRLRAYARSDEIFADCPGIFERMSDEELANLAITLIHQATYMLRRLIERQQEMFVENGGIRERMSRARRSYRSSEK